MLSTPASLHQYQISSITTYTSYSIDNNGVITLLGSTGNNYSSGYVFSAYTTYNDGTPEVYYYSSNDCCHYYCEKILTYSRGSASYGEDILTTQVNGYYNGYYYKYIGPTYTYSKGTTLYGTVTSLSKNKYPTSGYQSGYWYELIT